MLKTIRVIPALMSLLLVSLAFPASAHATDGYTVNVSFAQQDEGTDQIRTQVYTRDDGITIRIEQRGNEVRVWIDDEEVPEDQLRRENRTLTIFDAEGNVVQRVQLLSGARDRAARMPGRRVPSGAPPSGRPGVPPGGGMHPARPGVFPGGAAPPGRPISGGIAPPGMPRTQIGIGMGRIDAALAQHLQLDPDEVIIITQVREGAPADLAGLKPHDIIIKVDGESPVTQQRLYRVVHTKEPGESVTFTILRAGEEREIAVEVESIEGRLRGPAASDQERAQQIQRHLERLRDRVQRFAPEFDAEVFRDEFLRKFEHGLAFEFDEQTKQKLKELAEEAARHAEEYAARLKEEFDGDRFSPRRWRHESDIFDSQRLFERLESIPGIEFQREDGVLKGIVVTPHDDRRLRREPRLDAAIERLEKRLERLEQQLENVERTLDRIAEDR